MKVKDIVAEDFINYKLPSMFIISATCDWKCCTEQGMGPELCQNSGIASMPVIDVDDESIYQLFHTNDITKAVVVGGLEPFLQFDELLRLIQTFREHGELCDFIIYTGYEPGEISDELARLAELKNIIVKFGRYIPNQVSVYDEILGVTLASPNQRAVRIS